MTENAWQELRRAVEQVIDRHAQRIEVVLVGGDRVTVYACGDQLVRADIKPARVGERKPEGAKP